MPLDYSSGNSRKIGGALKLGPSAVYVVPWRVVIFGVMEKSFFSIGGRRVLTKRQAASELSATLGRRVTAHNIEYLIRREHDTFIPNADIMIGKQYGFDDDDLLVLAEMLKKVSKEPRRKQGTPKYARPASEASSARLRNGRVGSA